MSECFEDVMRACLKEVCIFMQWPVGHFYLVSDKNSSRILMPTPLWYLEDENKFESFVNITESSIFQPGEGLPGEVLATGKPHWIMDIHKSTNFSRARKTKELNLKSGFAFPIMVKNQTAGVMEFFSTEISQPDEWTLEVMANIGVQVGQAYHRIQMEGKLVIRDRAMEQSLSSVMITDAGGVIEYVNPAFCDYTGYSFEEAVGNRASILKSGHHSPEFYQGLWETILSGKEWKNEVCNRKKDGNIYWVFQSISPILDDLGNISNFISFTLDDTRRREAVEKLKDYSRELERSNRVLHDFAAIASHDLQEPLRKIIAFGERLKNTLSNLDERSSDYLSRMQNSARRMEGFIQGLLKYSQVSAKRRTFEAVDLDQTAHDVLDDLELRISLTMAQVVVKKLPVLEADPMQMRQLLRCLIGNSIKFHRKGVQPVIRLSCSQDTGDRWRIAVEDNGIGFDEKYAERIFKPFERLHGHGVYEGNGLGLAICKRILENHKGEIHAHSQLGVGSSFIVLLPAKQVHDGAPKDVPLGA